MISAEELRDRFASFVWRQGCRPESTDEEAAALHASVAALDDILAGRMRD